VRNERALGRAEVAGYSSSSSSIRRSARRSAFASARAPAQRQRGLELRCDGIRSTGAASTATSVATARRDRRPAAALLGVEVAAIGNRRDAVEACGRYQFRVISAMFSTWTKTVTWRSSFQP